MPDIAACFRDIVSNTSVARLDTTHPARARETPTCCYISNLRGVRLQFCILFQVASDFLEVSRACSSLTKTGAYVSRISESTLEQVQIVSIQPWSSLKRTILRSSTDVKHILRAYEDLSSD